MVCPLNGRMTVEIHYQAMQNAFAAGYRAAGGIPDERLTGIMDKEDIWLHDPRAAAGFKAKPLQRTGSRGRPSGSGSGGNGDPASKSKGGYKQELADIPYDPERCCRRHWNGGFISSDGLQAGAQCTNAPESENGFCTKCEARYQSSLQGKVDWHGSFAKPVREDPGTKVNGKLCANGYPHWSKLPKPESEDGDDAAGTAMKKTSY